MVCRPEPTSTKMPRGEAHDKVLNMDINMTLNVVFCQHVLDDSTTIQYDSSAIGYEVRLDMSSNMNFNINFNISLEGNLREKLGSPSRGTGSPKTKEEVKQARNLRWEPPEAGSKERGILSAE